jgi:hypothetical protein
VLPRFLSSVISSSAAQVMRSCPNTIHFDFDACRVQCSWLSGAFPLASSFPLDFAPPAAQYTAPERRSPVRDCAGAGARVRTQKRMLDGHPGTAGVHFTASTGRVGSVVLLPVSRLRLVSTTFSYCTRRILSLVLSDRNAEMNPPSCCSSYAPPVHCTGTVEERECNLTADAGGHPK